MIFYDRSELIGKAVWTVQKVLLEAIVLVVILLLLFLGNLRAALVVSLILPLAVLTTFGVMRMVGLVGQHHVARRPCDRHRPAGRLRRGGGRERRAPPCAPSRRPDLADRVCA